MSYLPSHWSYMMATNADMHTSSFTMRNSDDRCCNAFPITLSPGNWAWGNSPSSSPVYPSSSSREQEFSCNVVDTGCMYKRCYIDYCLLDHNQYTLKHQLLYIRGTYWEVVGTMGEMQGESSARTKGDPGGMWGSIPWLL